MIFLNKHVYLYILINFKSTTMKNIYVFFAAFILSACSKEDVYSPWNLKNGQEVEVLVSHRYGAINDDLLMLPHNQPAEMPLYNFNDREPGYTYRVKAKMVAEKVPPQDGPAYHLEYIETLGKEKYEGDETFELHLIQSTVPGGPVIVLLKEEENYLFHSNIQLIYNDSEIGNQLEGIWQNREEIYQDYKDNIFTEPKWRWIQATVSHDPDNFGKAYVVSHIEFISK